MQPPRTVPKSTLRWPRVGECPVSGNWRGRAAGRRPIEAALDTGNRSIGSLTAPTSSEKHHCPRQRSVVRVPAGPRPHAAGRMGAPRCSHRGSPPLVGPAEPGSAHPASGAGHWESPLSPGCGRRVDPAGPPTAGASRSRGHLDLLSDGDQRRGAARHHCSASTSWRSSPRTSSALPTRSAASTVRRSDAHDGSVRPHQHMIRIRSGVRSLADLAGRAGPRAGGGRGA